MNEALALTFGDLDAAVERARGRADAAPGQALTVINILTAAYRADLSDYGGFSTTPVPDRYGQGDPLPPFAQPLLRAALAEHERPAGSGGRP